MPNVPPHTPNLPPLPTLPPPEQRRRALGKPRPDGTPQQPPRRLEDKLDDDDIREFNRTFDEFDPEAHYLSGLMCYYCGGPDNADHNVHYDHTIPRCIIRPRNDAVYVGYRGRRRGRADPNCPPDARVICVRACKRCNLLLSYRYFPTIRARVEWVRNAILQDPNTSPDDPIHQLPTKEV